MQMDFHSLFPDGKFTHGRESAPLVGSAEDLVEFLQHLFLVFQDFSLSLFEAVSRSSVGVIFLPSTSKNPAC